VEESGMKKIGIEMEQDIQLLKTIAKTGLMVEKFLPMIGLNLTRLRQHLASENIEKKGRFLIYGSATNVYTLTPRSKKRMQGDFLINLYKGDTGQLEHDYVLLKTYLYLSGEEKESWLTESRLQIDYPHSAKTTDGMYMSNGRRIGVEIITSSYTPEDIEAKKEFIRYNCDDYIMLHTHKTIEYSL
jgi:hypothetical protein